MEEGIPAQGHPEAGELVLEPQGAVYVVQDPKVRVQVQLTSVSKRRLKTDRRWNVDKYSLTRRYKHEVNKTHILYILIFRTKYIYNSKYKTSRLLVFIRFL